MARLAAALIAVLGGCMVIAPSAGALGGGGPKQNSEVYHASQNPAAISADGAHLAFTDSATNLSLQDGDAGTDVFARNLDTAGTMLVSVHPPSSYDLGPSIDPSISGDGRFVAFTSRSANLVPEDGDFADDAYVRDMQTGTVTLASRASGVNGPKQNGNLDDYWIAITPITRDGRYVAFRSNATNLSPDVTDSSGAHIYVRDLQNNTTILVDRATGAAGTPGNNDASVPSISADGRYVAFATWATNLDPADTDDATDVYVRDLQANTTTLVDRANGASGAKALGSYFPSISGDGQRVAFTASFQGGPPEDFDQAYVRDLQANTTTLVSRASGSNGVRGDGYSETPSISEDGRYVGFTSGATNLSPDDSDSTGDIFVRDLQNVTTTLVSRASGASGTKSDGGSFDATLSADSRYIAFASTATNLSPDDTDTFFDMYVRDMQANITSLESRASPGYVRPNAASPTRVSLVPAYPACTTPDRVHGPPLAFSSCSNPQLASGFLTVGTNDANGAPPNFAGYVKLTTIIGRPRCCDTDVKITASMSDVRRAADLSDYTGELQLRLPLRITDKVNDVDGFQPGTMVDYTFPVTIPCAATSSAGIGSTCSVSTAANVLVPGAVPDGRRTIWALGEIAVYDGGPDGDVDTPAGDTLFAEQGVFVP